MPVLTRLTVLARLTRLTVLARLGLAVLARLLRISGGLAAVLVLLRIALRIGLRRRVVRRGRLLVLPVFSGRVRGCLPGLLLSAGGLPALVAGGLLPG